MYINASLFVVYSWNWFPDLAADDNICEVQMWCLWSFMQMQINYKFHWDTFFQSVDYFLDIHFEHNWNNRLCHLTICYTVFSIICWLKTYFMVAKILFCKAHTCDNPKMYSKQLVLIYSKSKCSVRPQTWMALKVLYRSSRLNQIRQMIF